MKGRHCFIQNVSYFLLNNNGSCTSDKVSSTVLKMWGQGVGGEKGEGWRGDTGDTLTSDYV